MDAETLAAIRERADEPVLGSPMARTLDQAILDRRALLDHIAFLGKKLEVQKEISRQNFEEWKKVADEETARLNAVRELVAEWEKTGPASGPFPDRVVLDVDTEILDPLRQALGEDQ